MTHGETNTRDQRVLDAYRAASDSLDERPNAATRASVLAAAARAAEAQPQDAMTGATARRARLHKHRSIAPSKRPLAMVASFLVATVAVVLALETREHHVDTSTATMDREGPRPAESKPEGAGASANLATTETTPTDKRNDAPAAPPAAASPPAPARPAAKPAQPAAARTEPEAPARAKTEVARVDVDQLEKQAAARRDQMQLDSEIMLQNRSKASGAMAAPAAPPPLAQTEEQPKEKDQSGNRALAERAASRALAEPNGAAESRMVKARPVQRSPAVADDAIENDPARWAERISALRDAGKDDDADRELTRLRERFPDFKVPPNALRRTGTR